ncbi:MAG: pyrroline-5-carboxylate reductase family protein [candidate division WOR-3 bacterium]
MKAHSLGFIGGGRITRLFLTGWQRAKINLKGITVSDKEPDVLARLSQLFPAVQTTLDNTIPAKKDIVFIALHPPAIRTALPSLKGVINPTALVVSLAPVITFTELRQLLNHSRLVRMIPNAPSMIGKGYNPVAFSPEIGKEERQSLEPLFSVLGDYPESPEETLEAYAILSAMGPTYFWFQWQNLRDLGEKFGLKPVDTDRALLKMIEGAAQLLLASGLNPADVLDTIPLKPLAAIENTITSTTKEKLLTLYQKLKDASCEHLKRTGKS